MAHAPPHVRHPLLSLVTVLAVALLASCNGCNGGDTGGDTGVGADTAPQPPGPPNVITIAHHGADSVEVDKLRACGMKGRAVHWRWGGEAEEIERWIVKLAGGSPFVSGATMIESNPNNPTTPRGGVIANTSLDSTYSYVVRLVLPSGDTVGRDPIIVIREPDDDSMAVPMMATSDTAPPSPTCQ